MTHVSAADMKALLWSAPAWRTALKKLYVQVLIAIALGLLLGAVYPSLATEMKPFSLYSWASRSSSRRAVTA